MIPSVVPSITMPGFSGAAGGGPPRPPKPTEYEIHAFTRGSADATMYAAPWYLTRSFAGTSFCSAGLSMPARSIVSCAGPSVPFGSAGYHTTTRRLPARCRVVKPTTYGPGFAYGASDCGVVVVVVLDG